MIQDNLYKTDIVIGFGELGSIVTWICENCSDNWNYEVLVSAGKDAGLYRFQFQEDIDYVKFTLWKT